MSPESCAGGMTAGKGSRNRPRTPRLADRERIDTAREHGNWPQETFLSETVRYWWFQMPSEILQNVRETQARGNEETRSSVLLAIKQKRSPDEQIWYMRSPLGKNQLGKFLSDAVSAAGLKSSKRKVCNHSVRKTSIARLLHANFPENYVMQLSGHKNIQSLSAYKSASLGHQRQMSDALSGRKESATASSSDINSDESVKVPSVSSIGYSSSSNALEAVFAGANISSMSGCTFQFMTGPVSIVNKPAPKRPRRLIIGSDDED